MTSDWDANLNSVEENEGHGITHGADGKIVSAHLSSERARELGKLGGAAAGRRNAAEAEALADSILAAIEMPDDPQAKAEAQERLIRAASKIASKGGAQAMAALSALASQISQAFASAPKAVMPKPGEVCGICGRPDPAAPLRVDGSAMVWLRKLLVEAAPQIIGGNDV
jgi:hypothetical protein